MTTLDYIRGIAITAHCGQRYGKHPYSHHLDAVVGVLRDYGFGEETLAVGYLHDILEDTQITPEDLLGDLGVDPKIVRAVVFCTDEKGKSRRIRKANTYQRVREDLVKSYAEAWLKQGILVKMADRIANLRASHQDDPKRLIMYRKEATAFLETYALPSVLGGGLRWSFMVDEYRQLTTV